MIEKPKTFNLMKAFRDQQVMVPEVQPEPEPPAEPVTPEMVVEEATPDLQSQNVQHVHVIRLVTAADEDEHPRFETWTGSSFALPPRKESEQE